MALTQKIDSLATRIGAEFKTVRTEISGRASVASVDAKPDLLIGSMTPAGLGSGDFWLDTSAEV